MTIQIEYTATDIIKLIARDISEKTGTDVDTTKINVLTTEPRKLAYGWDEAAVKAIYNDTTF